MGSAVPWTGNFANYLIPSLYAFVSAGDRRRGQAWPAWRIGALPSALDVKNAHGAPDSISCDCASNALLQTARAA